MKQKVGILGGTFNPVHNGHITLAETAYQQLGLTNVIFMPSGQSYSKRNMQILPADERLKLIHQSIKDIPYFKTSDMELKRPGNTYTYETLEILHKDNPAVSYYFIVGADCLFNMEKWVKPERIFSLCSIVAAVRNGVITRDLAAKARELTEHFHANIILLDFNEINISSSEIRQLLKNGRSVEHLMPKNAAAYLAEINFFK